MKLHPIFSDYVISEEGNVYNFHTQKKLKPYDSGKGHKVVKLRKDNKTHTKGIHRLMMETYNPISNSHLYDAHHNNEVKDDNRLENLKWELKEEHTRNHHKGKVLSEETRKRMSEGSKGRCQGTLWWNNGTKNIRSKECPGEGWMRGRITEIKG